MPPSSPSPSSLYVVVSTHRRYAEARAALLQSLEEAKWPISQTILVFGEEDREILHSPNEVHLVHNIYEYNAFLGATTLPHEDAAFVLLHDTCEVGPDFVPRLLNQYETYKRIKADIYWLSHKGQCNICIFNMSVARKMYERFRDTHTMDKMQAVRMEWNKSLFACDASIVQHFCEEHSHVQGVVARYASRVQREKLYFPSIDMYKFYVVISRSCQHRQIP